MSEQLKKPSVLSIMQATSEVFGVSIGQLLGKSKLGNLVSARQSAMWACKDFGYGPNYIGFRMKRDHSTVNHGAASVAKHRNADPEVAVLLDAAVARAMEIQGGDPYRPPQPPRLEGRLPRKRRCLDTARQNQRAVAMDGQSGVSATMGARRFQKPAVDHSPGQEMALERLARRDLAEAEIGSRLWCEIQNARFFLAVGYPYQPTLAANATERRGVAE